MDEEEKSKSINFVKKHGTYKNQKGSWSEYYLCLREGSKQVRNDHVEGGSSQKKRRIQKESKKVGCKCALRIQYQPSSFNELVIVYYWYKHNGHVPSSHSDIRYLKKSKEIIAEIRNGHGIPLVWLLTESQDSETIKIWFRALKEDGWVDPVNVILDNDDAEINAIRDIFTTSNIFLYNALIEFEKKWQCTPAIQYFNTQYRRKKECYRRNQVLGTNTNNYIEAYHKKIKYFYLMTRLNRRIDFLINELVTKILPDYHQQTIQRELGVGRMSSHHKAWRQFELNSIGIDNSSVFRLDISTYIIKSSQDENDYTIEQTGDNALTLVCNCEAYLGNPVPCKHIFVVARKYNIQIPEQITYLPINGDEEQKITNNTVIRNQENSFKRRIEKINHDITQQLEHFDIVRQKIDLNSIPLDKRENVVNKLEEIYRGRILPNMEIDLQHKTA
ncbi:3785_t:CDS:2, partial [Racocetra fulgida]